ncbi:MAG: S41 family peptidase [Pseudomonadota bacterium]
MRLMPFLAGTTLSLTLAAGATPLPGNVPITELAPFAGPTEPMFGVWKSNGYGLVVVLSEDGISAYHVTEELCLPYTEDDSSFMDYVDSALLSEDGDTLHVGAAVEQHTYQLTRLEAVPARCATPPTDTPQGNFDSFVSLMRQHYAFFDLHGVDWEAEVAAARGKVASDMTDRQLFDLFAHMLRDLDDAHLGLNAEIDGEPVKLNPDQGRTYSDTLALGVAAGLDEQDAKRAFRRALWLESIPETVLGGTGAIAANDRIQYGLAADDVGYFAMITVGGYSEAGFEDPTADVAVLDGILDAALARFEDAGVAAVIIDASFNHGGYDFISRQIASRFADGPAKIYAKHAADASAPYQTQLWLHPSDKKRFTGPVYLMTSDVTVSGGETLAMSMRALPNVTHIGGVTRGALSDILEKRLPNGWTLGLSNEVYLDHESRHWEDIGIVPDSRLGIFPTDDPVGGHARAILRVVELARNAD